MAIDDRYDEGSPWSVGITSGSPRFFLTSDGELIPFDNIAFICQNGNQGSWLVHLKHGEGIVTPALSNEDYLCLLKTMGYTYEK